MPAGGRDHDPPGAVGMCSAADVARVAIGIEKIERVVPVTEIGQLEHDRTAGEVDPRVGIQRVDIRYPKWLVPGAGELAFVSEYVEPPGCGDVLWRAARAHTRVLIDRRQTVDHRELR